MSLLTRTFTQIIKRSTATTRFLLKSYSSRSVTVCSISTESPQQSIKKEKDSWLFISIYKGDKKQQQQQQQLNKYEYLLVDIKGKNSNVALVQLNRPKTFNSLCDGLLKEVWI